MENFGKIRINKYLAQKDLCSRREADIFIKSGLVRINGRVAILGDKVSATDKVELKKAGVSSKKLIYVAYNKPIGIVTHSPVEGEQGIIDILDLDTKVYPVGRLDKASHGLIILTNDGRVTDKLLSPDKLHEKEYIIEASKPLKDRWLRKLSTGVRIEGYMTKPAKVKPLGQNALSIIITEGKKHQIRRMCTALGFDVIDLQRVRIMNIKLGSLKPGKHRILAGKELSEFLGLLGIASGGTK